MGKNKKHIAYKLYMNCNGLTHEEIVVNLKRAEIKAEEWAKQHNRPVNIYRIICELVYETIEPNKTEA